MRQKVEKMVAKQNIPTEDLYPEDEQMEYMKPKIPTEETTENDHFSSEQKTEDPESIPCENNKKSRKHITRPKLQVSTTIRSLSCSKSSSNEEENPAHGKKYCRERSKENLLLADNGWEKEQNSSDCNRKITENVELQENDILQDILLDMYNENTRDKQPKADSVMNCKTDLRSQPVVGLSINSNSDFQGSISSNSGNKKRTETNEKLYCKQLQGTDMDDFNIKLNISMDTSGKRDMKSCNTMSNIARPTRSFVFKPTQENRKDNEDNGSRIEKKSDYSEETGMGGIDENDFNNIVSSDPILKRISQKYLGDNKEGSGKSKNNKRKREDEDIGTAVSKI